MPLAWAGYKLGENWEDILPYFRPVSVPIALLVATVAGFWLYRRIQEVRRQGLEEDSLPTS